MASQESFYQLRLDEPTDWGAEEILVVRLSCEFDPNDQRLNFTLSDALVHDPLKVPEPLSAFVKALASANPPTWDEPRMADPKRRNWLGIPVRRPSYVVVVLVGQTKWRFRAGGPAITAKEDPRSDTFGPWHFKITGEPLPNTMPGDDCKIMAFAVVRRAKYEVAGFNFHVEFEQADGKHWLELIIDPDVPETGTEGFPFILPAVRAVEPPSTAPSELGSPHLGSNE